jgi:hypothetical protein
MISPKFARALTVAIMRRASRYYPAPGIVGVYPFDGNHYRTKAELREAVSEFCSGITYDEAARLQKNLNLVP